MKRSEDAVAEESSAPPPKRPKEDDAPSKASPDHAAAKAEEEETPRTDDNALVVVSADRPQLPAGVRAALADAWPASKPRAPPHLHGSCPEHETRTLRTCRRRRRRLCEMASNSMKVLIVYYVRNALGIKPLRLSRLVSRHAQTRLPLDMKQNPLLSRLVSRHAQARLPRAPDQRDAHRPRAWRAGSVLLRSDSVESRRTP